VRALDYGGIIMSLLTPDRAGRFANIVLGYDTEEKYLDNRRYFGAIIGRYANRIARGRFSLDGNVYQLATNQGTNHLHGGIKGFDKVVWSAETFRTSGSEGVAFSYTSRDGEEGYPGTLRVRVIYTLTDTNDLIVEYEATTDKPTVINLTQHTYFNLTGGVQDILDHELTIEADRFTPTDAMQIPTGEIVAVRGTAFDFTQRTRIGARIDGVHEQLVAAGGYDHNWVLRGSGGLAAAARVVEPKSGRTVEVSTTQPGVQFYAGNRLDRPRSGFCLETQHFPDSPNQPSFPSTILRPAETFRSKTVFAFGIDR
jgi:aldose 1-epimerase